MGVVKLKYFYLLREVIRNMKTKFHSPSSKNLWDIPVHTDKFNENRNINLAVDALKSLHTFSLNKLVKIPISTMCSGYGKQKIIAWNCFSLWGAQFLPFLRNSTRPLLVFLMASLKSSFFFFCEYLHISNQQKLIFIRRQASGQVHMQQVHGERDMWYVYNICESNIFISDCLNICWIHSRVQNNRHNVSISLRNSLWETKLFLTEFGLFYLGFFGCLGAVLLNCYL